VSVGRSGRAERGGELVCDNDAAGSTNAVRGIGCHERARRGRPEAADGTGVSFSERPSDPGRSSASRAWGAATVRSGADHLGSALALSPMRSRNARGRESVDAVVQARGSRMLEVGRSRNSGERAAHRHAVVAFGAGGLAGCGGFELAVAAWGWSSPLGSSLPVLGVGGWKVWAASRTATRLWPAASGFPSVTTRAVVRPRTRGTARSRRTPPARRYRRCC